MATHNNLYRLSQWQVSTTHNSQLTTHKSPLARRIVLYSLAIVICGTLTVWSTSKVQAINSEAALSLSTNASSSQQSLVEALQKSAVSAFELAERGLALLKLSDRTNDASLYLQAAAFKDPHYRDAALYAGAAELALADSAWQQSPEVALRRTKIARELLEQARDIDPIHSHTFSLLDIAYTNLGQHQLAADARQKAQLFASVGKSS